MTLTTFPNFEVSSVSQIKVLSRKVMIIHLRLKLLSFRVVVTCVYFLCKRIDVVLKKKNPYVYVQ